MKGERAAVDRGSSAVWRLTVGSQSYMCLFYDVARVHVEVDDGAAV